MAEIIDVDQPLRPRRRIVVPAFQPIPDGRKNRVPPFSPEARLKDVQRRMATAPTGTPEYMALAAEAEDLERQVTGRVPSFGQQVGRLGEIATAPLRTPEAQFGGALAKGFVQPAVSGATFGKVWPMPEREMPQLRYDAEGRVLPPFLGTRGWGDVLSDVELVGSAMPATPAGYVAANVIAPAFARAGAQQVKRGAVATGRELVESYRAAPEAGFASAKKVPKKLSDLHLPGLTKEETVNLRDLQQRYHSGRLGLSDRPILERLEVKMHKAITRKEALERSRKTIEDAEAERLKIVEEEAKKGIQPESQLPKPPSPVAAKPAGREAEILAELKRLDRSEGLHASQYGRTVPPWATKASVNYGAPVSPASPAGKSWLRQKANDARGKLLLDELKQLRAGVSPPKGPALSVAKIAQAAEPIPPSVAKAAPAPPAPAQPGGAVPGIEQAAITSPAAPPPVLPPEPPAALGGLPPEKPKPEFAGNIRLSKYPEDIHDDLKAWASAHPEEVQAARRGVRSDVQVEADAQALLNDVGFMRKQTQWKAGQAWNPEEIVAMRGVLKAKREAALAARTAYQVADSTANLLRVSTAIQEAARAQEIVTGVTAESGRSLRQFRKEVFDAITANDTQKMEELLKRLGDKAKVRAVAEAFGKLDLNDPIAVNTFIRSVNKPKLLDYLYEIFINGILSSGKSTIINFGSNAVSLGVSLPEHALAAGVEAGMAKLQGRQVARFFEEVPAEAAGALMAIQDASKASLYTLKNGISPLEMSKWEFRQKAFKGKLGAVVNMPTRTLEAGDVGFKVMNSRAALNGLIVRKAKIEGQTGDALLTRIAELRANPTAELFEEADKFAEYRLFRQDPGKMANWLIRGRTLIPGLRYIIPFVRTPVNLLKFGIERSPLGILDPKVYRHILNKSPEASDDIARIMLGSTLAATIAWYFGNGRITGAPPRNPAARDRFYREGKQPYSIKVGNRWIQYQRLEPFNQPIAQVAAVVDAVNNGDKTADQKALQAVSTIGKNLVSQTYLVSIADLLDFLTNPEESTSAFLQRQATGLIPYSGAQRTTAQMLDRTIRKPETFPERVAAGIPALSQGVPPRLTAFGEEIQRQTPPWSPITTSRANENAVDTELGRLKMDIGFVGKTVGGKDLTREQRIEYQRLAGQLAKQAVGDLVTRPNYLKKSDADKEKAIRKVLDEARQEAREQLGLEPKKKKPYSGPVFGQPSGRKGPVFSYPGAR